jgi:MFS family permease
MKVRLPVFLGVFGVMALSNAIVPVLDRYASGTTAQGAIYAAYFLGAFLLVLPSGLLADRWGEAPLIQAGLLLTAGSGLVLAVSASPAVLFAARLAEGFGAGLFVPSALALLNKRPDHEQGSGYFLALLNLGLVVGLVGAGWLVVRLDSISAGVVIFTAMCAIPLAFSAIMGNPPGAAGLLPGDAILPDLARTLSRYFWLWTSAVVIIGVTGAVTALYPALSDLPPDLVALPIAAMPVATAAAVLVSSRAHLPPVPTIRAAALLMAAGVVTVFYSGWGFILVGWLAGMVQVAQLSYLAGAETRQGLVMGLFNTASYGGMAVFPFIAGLLADMAGFAFAFAVIAISSLCIAATIGRCRCPG